ncbi:hypothetical protein ACF0H5_022777 [Mactra antiquata]
MTAILSTSRATSSTSSLSTTKPSTTVLNTRGPTSMLTMKNVQYTKPTDHGSNITTEIKSISTSPITISESSITSPTMMSSSTTASISLNTTPISNTLDFTNATSAVSSSSNMVLTSHSTSRDLTTSVTSSSNSASTSQSTSGDLTTSVTSSSSSASTSRSTSRGFTSSVTSSSTSLSTSHGILTSIFTTSMAILSGSTSSALSALPDVSTSMTSQVNTKDITSSSSSPGVVSETSSTAAVSTDNLTGHSSTTVSPRVCPSGSRQFENSCYLINRREMSFRDAKAFCKTQNAYLVHVDTSEENEYLKQIMREFQDPVQYWIGIMDVVTESVWVYYDTGKNVTYFDWVPGEPDGTHEFDGAKEADCAVFDPFQDFRWRDEQCSPYHYSQTICEL